MRVNIAAFAFTVVLTATGIWLASSIADMQAAQDCVLMGRHNCAAIAASPAETTRSQSRFVTGGSEQPL